VIRKALALGLVLVGSGALACGDDKNDRTGSRELDQLTSSLEKAVDSTYRGRFQLDGDTEEDGKLSMTMRVAGTGDGSRLRMSGSFTQGGQTGRMVAIARGDVAWFRFQNPRLEGALPPGKRWVKMGASAFGGDTLTPSQFAALIEAAGDVEDLGNEPIRGTSARHLKATVDLAKAARMAGGPKAASFLRLVRGGAAVLPVDVWIGADGRPIRYFVNVELPRPGGGEPQFARLTLDVDEYDVHVTASPPPAREVIAQSELE
jgi:hypothetical protein